jgi:hypothetical protein
MIPTDRFDRKYELGTIFAFVKSGYRWPILAMITCISGDKVRAHRLHKYVGGTIVRPCGNIALSRAIIITDIPNTAEFEELKELIEPYIRS